MRIGICTTDFDRAMPARALFQRAADLGFEVVQLAFGSVEECDFSASAQIEIPEAVSPDALRAIAAASREAGVPIGAVNGTWNMAHPDAAVREEGLRRFDGFLNAVAALEVPIVSLCSGSRSRDGLWTYDETNVSESAWRDMAEGMARAVKMAERRGITLAIETEASNVVDTPERARRVLDEVGSPNLKMVLDAANLFHTGEAAPENVRPTLDRAMECFGREVVLAHGKDIMASEGIRFCGAGFGIVDFPYMIDWLRRVNFRGDMMLHGIYAEADMPVCRAFIAGCLSAQVPTKENGSA